MEKTLETFIHEMNNKLMQVIGPAQMLKKMIVL
jgi:hypothetical protein